MTSSTKSPQVAHKITQSIACKCAQMIFMLLNCVPGLARLIQRVAATVRIGHIEAVEFTGEAVEGEDLDDDDGVQETLEVDQSVARGEFDPPKDEVESEVVVLQSVERLLKLRKRPLDYAKGIFITRERQVRSLLR